MATILENLNLEIKHFENAWKYINKDTNLCYDTIKWLLDRGLIQVSSVVELAIASVAGTTVISLNEADLSDGSDSKAVSVRTCGYGKKYSAPVTGLFNKTGTLRVQCYERKLQQFYYFAIPNTAYQHIPKSSNIEIPFELDGLPKKLNSCKINWWLFECKSFEEMATTNYGDL